MIAVRVADRDDAVAVGRLMRKSDRDEIWALHRGYPVRTCTQSWQITPVTWLAYDLSGPVALFGITPLSTIGMVGSPWLLGTDTLREHNRDLIELSRQFIEHHRRRYMQMKNIVWEKNRASQRYLTAIGFTLSDPKTNAYGEEYREFRMDGYV